MPDTTNTYDGAKVDITVAGITVFGKARGTFIKVTRDNPSWTNKTGADGEGARAKSNDKSGTIEITCLQTSLINDLLSALANEDELTGDALGPFLMKDKSGRTVVEAQFCWIEKPADLEFGDELTDRVWVIKSNSIDIFIAGN